ncbi:MAG: MraY family glycosyltransferase [Chitinophagaceae bacterium]
MNRIFLSAAGIAAGIIVTFFVRKTAIKFRIVNDPNPIVPQHTVPVAYLGGLAILISVSSVLIVIYFFFPGLNSYFKTEKHVLTAIITDSILFTLLGLYDDLKQLKAITKFSGQLLLSVIAVSIGLQSGIFGNDTLDKIFSVFWILFVVNAVNFTDVCDGLMSSICAVTFLTIALLVPGINLFYLVFASATIGFLFFNAPRASIFLGDAGSHLIGFLFAATGLAGTTERSVFDAVVWLWLIAAIPVFELIFITTIRIRKGLPWWKGSPDHFSLRMQAAGLSRWQINIIAILVSLLTVTVACLFLQFDVTAKSVTVFLILLFFAICWKVLLKYEVTKTNPVKKTITI